VALKLLMPSALKQNGLNDVEEKQEIALLRPHTLPT